MSTELPAANEPKDSSDRTPPYILQYLRENLHKIEMSKAIEYKSVKPSGETTKLTIVPKVLVCHDAEELVQIANTALQNPKIAESRLKDATITSPGDRVGHLVETRK